METKIINPKKELDIAADILRGGGLVAIPTETVYGLGANALDSEAVSHIFEAKGRAQDNPLIVHIADLADWAPLVTAIPEQAMRLAETFWPGPLTIILKKSDQIPDAVSAGLDTVAVRMPSHPIARDLIARSGIPVAAPSANNSGSPSPTSYAHVLCDMDGKIDAVIDGGICEVGVESTVITLAGETPRLLRPGGITVGQLESVLGPIEIDPGVLNEVKETEAVSSPGMKYKHYAPNASVILVRAKDDFYTTYVNAQAGPGVYALCYEEDLPGLQVPSVSFGKSEDYKQQAKELFEALHQLDENGAKTVYARMPEPQGVGLAVYNRLLRAAAFHIVRPYKKPCILGITGKSGAGKTTLSNALRKEGAFILNADFYAREVTEDEALLEDLRRAFGWSVIKDGKLDRAELARIAFETEEQTARLNTIIHPVVVKRMLSLAKKAKKAGHPIIVLDAPALIESGLDSHCDFVVVVEADEETRFRRLTERDSHTEEQIRMRMQAQKPDSYYTARADLVLQTGDGSNIQALVQKIMEFCG